VNSSNLSAMVVNNKCVPLGEKKALLIDLPAWYSEMADGAFFPLRVVRLSPNFLKSQIFTLVSRPAVASEYPSGWRLHVKCGQGENIQNRYIGPHSKQRYYREIVDLPDRVDFLFAQIFVKRQGALSS
jgi:hypothetical protein